MIPMSKCIILATPEPLLISETSVSRAYARILCHVVGEAGKEISPLIVTISGFGPKREIPEDAELRATLDTLLVKKGKRSVEDVAYTIFPQRLWDMARPDRAQLFAFYRMALPAYKAMNRTANGRGLYFEQLIMFGRGPCDGNQLEYILSQYNARPSVRRSMLQATTFDPERDHTASAQLGFPCLQQVSFVPTGAGLIVNAFYATQQLFDKAYGNYLGLAQLGAFMAHEMNMPLARLNINVGVAKLERISKTDAGLAPVVVAAKACLAAAPSQPAASTPSLFAEAAL
jgi:hypothetical protein